MRWMFRIKVDATMDPIRSKLFISESAFQPTPTGRALGANTSAGATDGFLGALNTALERVNTSQLRASELAKQFQLNAPDASLEQTMIAMQQASVGFQAALQVRSKIIAAYHDIMNMSV